MKNPKSIFFLIYLLFHVALLGISIYVNLKSEDFEFLLKLRNNMDLMIYASVLGLVLFGINMILVSMESRNKNRHLAKLENEKNELKAKMFDLQDATASRPTTTPATEEDRKKGDSLE